MFNVYLLCTLNGWLSLGCALIFVLFFFKQKTAYEMRISDWSSDVCSSDLAARQAGSGRVIAVVQPHRYSRLHDLFEQFCTCLNEADTVMVADVYAPGEQQMEGVDREHLV